MAPTAPWSIEDKILLLYFSSRGIGSKAFHDVIMLKTGRDRTKDAITRKVRSMRKEQTDSGMRDFIDTAGEWRLEDVDLWLTMQKSKSEIEALVKMDDEITSMLESVLFLRVYRS